jgi:hypothetical protein
MIDFNTILKNNYLPSKLYFYGRRLLYGFRIVGMASPD